MAILSVDQCNEHKLKIEESWDLLGPDVVNETMVCAGYLHGHHSVCFVSFRELSYDYAKASWIIRCQLPLNRFDVCFSSVWPVQFNTKPFYESS